LYCGWYSSLRLCNSSPWKTQLFHVCGYDEDDGDDDGGDNDGGDSHDDNNNLIIMARMVSESKTRLIHSTGKILWNNVLFIFA